jgi:hypothetical protein
MRQMSGTMRIDLSFNWATTGSSSGYMDGNGTAELTVDIRCHGDRMPDGSVLNQRVKALFTQALGAALLTEGPSEQVVVRERG